MATTGKNGRFKQQKRQLQDYAAKASNKVISNYRGPMAKVSTTEGNRGVAKVVRGPISSTRYKRAGEATVTTKAARKAKNRNTTPQEARVVGATGKTRVRSQIIPKPFKGLKTRPYAGKARPVLASQLSKRKKK